jgi:hypothetical protein
MACWKEKNAPATIGAFNCAAAMIGDAFPPLGIPLSVVTAATSLALARAELDRFLEGSSVKSMRAGLELVGKVTSMTHCAGGTGELASQMSETLPELEKQLDEIAGKMKSLSDTAIHEGKFAAGDFELLMSKSASLAAQFAKIGEGASSLGECLNSIEHGGEEVLTAKTFLTASLKFVKSTTESFKKLSPAEKLNLLSHFVDCGIAIVAGAWVAGDNTVCALDDYRRIREQSAALDRMTEKALDQAYWKNAEKLKPRQTCDDAIFNAAAGMRGDWCKQDLWTHGRDRCEACCRRQDRIKGEEQPLLLDVNHRAHCIVDWRGLTDNRRNDYYTWCASLCSGGDPLDRDSPYFFTPGKSVP